jgi:hypothetical protein
MKKFGVSILAGLMALAILTSPDVARAQNVRNCRADRDLARDLKCGTARSFARFIIPFDTQYEP